MTSKHSLYDFYRYVPDSGTGWKQRIAGNVPRTAAGVDAAMSSVGQDAVDYGSGVLDTARCEAEAKAHSVAGRAQAAMDAIKNCAYYLTHKASDAGDAAGQAARNGAKGAPNTGQQAAESVRGGAASVEQGVRNAGKAAAEGVRRAGQTVEQSAGKVRDEL